jgi:dihydropteroate synthase
LLSASNKPFLGAVLDLDIDRRGEASLAAAAIGVSLGCRIVRVHDVARTRLVCDSLTAVVEAA